MRRTRRPAGCTLLAGLDAVSVRPAARLRGGPRTVRPPPRRDLVELTLERDRISDAEIVHVENVVAVVGDESLAATARSAAARGELPGDQRRAMGMTSIGNGKRPSVVTSLGIVDDAHEAPRGPRR